MKIRESVDEFKVDGVFCIFIVREADKLIWMTVL